VTLRLQPEHERVAHGVVDGMCKPRSGDATSSSKNVAENYSAVYVTIAVAAALTGSGVTVAT
jgi:hypothetical protein